VVVHQNQLRMPAGDEEGQNGECRRFVERIVGVAMQPVRVKVRLQMVHRDEWQSFAERRAFREVQPHEQRSGQSWPIRHSNGVQVLPPYVRVAERLFDDRRDGLDVRARGQFREDAAVLRVQIHLRSDHVRQNGASPLDNGRRRLIARCFDS
jgi:hypothetical protein